MGRNILTSTEAEHLIIELPYLLAQSIHDTQSTEKYQKIGAKIVALSDLGNKCLWVLRESTKADGREFYNYEKTTLEDFATKYAKFRLTNSLDNLKKAFNMLNDTLNAEYNIENAKNYFSKTAEVESDIADSSDSISFDKSSKPLKIYDDQLTSSIAYHDTIMNPQQNLKQYIGININYRKEPISGSGFPQLLGQPEQFPPPQPQNQLKQFRQQLSQISLKKNGQDIFLYEWKLFSQEEKIKYAEIYGNGSYCENTIICYLDNNTEPIDKLYFIGRWSCLAVLNGENYRYAILVSGNSELNIDEFNRTIASTLSLKSLDENNQDFIKKAYNISDQPSPSAVSSTNNTKKPEPASDLGFNQGSGKANTAETSVEVSQRKTDDDERKINSSQTIKQDLKKTGHNKKNKSQKSGEIEKIFTEATTKFGENINGKNLAKKGFGRKFFEAVEEYVAIDELGDLITEIYSTTDFKGKIFNDVKKISDLEKIVNKKITSKNIGLSAKGLCLMGVAYAYADYIKTEPNDDTKKIKTAKTILNQLPKTIKNLDRTGLRKTTLVTFTKQIEVLSGKVIEKYGWQ